VSDTAEGGLLDVLEATAYFAGVRAAYVAVILPPSADNEVWVGRARRNANAALRVLNASGRRTGNVRGAGAVRWDDLRAVLTELGRSGTIPANERALAQTTARWLGERLSRREWHLLAAAAAVR
jgi:hypothetical protein